MAGNGSDVAAVLARLRASWRPHRRHPPGSIDLGLAILGATALPGTCHTLDQIAAYCDCAPERIRQIEQKALRKLRRRFHRKSDTLAREIMEEFLRVR
jgi:hypothetical protein